MKNHKKIIAMVLVFLTAFSSFFSINEAIECSAASNTDLELELSVGNSWSSGGNSFSQVDAKVINNSSKTIKNWVATIPVGNNAIVDSSWNVVSDIEDGILTATGVDHNKTISAKTSITFGLILKNADGIDISAATITTDDAGNTPQPTAKPTQAPTVKPTTKPDPTAPTTKPTVKPTVAPTTSPIIYEGDVPPKTTDDWLHTDGSKILDKDGKEVWLTGTNWFGYNTGTNTFDGIWSCDLNSTLAEIANRGFNLLRVPFSAELILAWENGKYPEACYNDYVNDYLAGMNSLEIWDYVVGRCRKEGIKIMIDIHSAETNAAGHFAPLWYTGKISEKDYLEALSWMADRYKDDDTIIAYDLKNEPHGAVGDKEKAIWNDSKAANNWKYGAQKAAMAVLDANPNVLVMVEGIQIYPKDINKDGDYVSTDKNDYYNTWWGGNLRGVADYPVDLGKYQDKLVYSPHDYGPAVSDQPWFTKGFDKDSLYNDCWRDNWFYIQESDTAPLLIGEWGGFMTEPNLTWMSAMREFIIENRINHTFWCFNANSGDTGGLVAHDFTTWDEEKYAFVKKCLWQKGNKFVGLDHKIPLGKNGITLSDY